MYANLRGLTPNLLPDYFHSNFDYHHQTTRSSSLLHIPYARKFFDSHPFLYMLQLFETLYLITLPIR